MKLFKNIIILILGTFVLASCNINEAPEFDDADAFIAFRSSSLTIGEEQKDTIKIGVLLTSLTGMSASIDFEIVSDSTTTAVEGTHFNVLNTSRTLTFTADKPMQYIELMSIDNDTFDGDVKFSIKLLPSSTIKLGDSKKIDITISDDEHPLLFILGTLNAHGLGNWGDTEDWKVTFEKDADDLKKVWISNLVPDGSSVAVYGVVNDDKTEIKIPVGQVIAKSNTYPKIVLNGFDGETGEKIPTGGNIIGEIAADGLITIKDYFGSQVFSDEAMTASLGWYNLLTPGVTMKK